MRVKTTELGVAAYLKPDGPLTEDNLPPLEKSVRAKRAEGASNLVIDLKSVPVLDSRGLEFLLDLSVALRETGGSLRLAGANRVCADILALTGLDQMIPIFEDLESAGRSFL